MKSPRAGLEASSTEPFWYKDAVFYELRVGAFSDSNAHTLFKLQRVSSAWTTKELASSVQSTSNSCCQ